MCFDRAWKICVAQTETPPAPDYSLPQMSSSSTCRQPDEQPISTDAHHGWTQQRIGCNEWLLPDHRQPGRRLFAEVEIEAKLELGCLRHTRGTPRRLEDDLDVDF